MNAHWNSLALSAFLFAVAMSICTFVGCGLDNAPQAKAQLDSSNQMKELILAVRLYHDSNDDQWPDKLSEVATLTETSFDQLMNNPITEDNPGYEYVKPEDGTDLKSTVILHQLRNGQRATDLKVGYIDNRVAELTGR